MSLFAYHVSSKKNDVSVPSELETNHNLDDIYYDEENETVASEFNDYQPTNNPINNYESTNKLIKKTLSLHKLPKYNELTIDIDCDNTNYISMDYCSRCKTRIYKKCNTTYHAYDRIWCYNCWKTLKLVN